MVSVGTIVWLSSELMFFAGLFAMYFTARSQAGGNWPPSELAKKSGGRGYHLHAQENKVVMPSAFSPE